jgi:MYXO-CTERM domain-containing protein
MFRFNVVAVLCLGLLVSCGPDAPERQAPEDSSQSDVTLEVAQAQLQVSQGALDFGKQKTGTSSAWQMVTLTNTGDMAVEISAISSSGPFATGPTTTPFTLAPAASKQLQVRFSPTAQGAATGVLTLSTNAPATPQVTVALTGTGVAFAADVTPSSLAFGQQRVGTTSVALTVTVHNTGGSSLQISAVSITQPFAVSPSTAFTLEPGESKALSVIFSPTAEGASTGSLTLSTNDPDRPSVVVSLTGSGVRPSLVLNPSSLTFGEQRVGTTSATQVVRLSNTGTGPIQITAFSTSGPFSAVTPPTVPFVLAPNAFQEFALRFSPTAQGAASGTFTLTTDSPEWASVSVALAGTGVQQPSLALSVNSLNYGQQRVGTTSAALNVTVSNTGDASLQVSAVSLNAPFAVSPSAAFTLAPGNSQALSVTFSPTAEGEATGTLTLTTNDPAKPTATVAVTGTGVKPSLVLSSTSLAFGEQFVNTTSMAQMVTVYNTGSGPIQVINVSIGPGEPFFVTPNTAFVLAAGASRELAVTFAPTFEGAATGTLTLTTDYAPLPTATVALMGNGVRPKLELSPTSLAFGEQRVGTSSAPKTVRVTNTGSGTLRITSVSTTAPFSVTPSAEFELPQHASRDLSVTFLPTAEGSFTGTLTLKTNSVETPTATVALAGTGVQQPTLALSATSLNFGQQRVGNSSAALNVVVSNTGTAPLQVSAVSMSGPFVVSPGEVFTLAPGNNRSLAVSFHPIQEGAATGSLILETNDPAQPQALISLSGKGVMPNLVLSPTSLAFGEQSVGATSAPKTVTVQNTGTDSALITAVTITGPFSLSPGPSLPLILAPNASMTLTVTFNPTTQGAATGHLFLTTDDPSSPNGIAALSGTGVSPKVVLNPTSLDFGDQRVGTASTPKTVTVSNTGSSVLRITSLTIGTGEPFSVTPNTAFDLAAGTSRELSVSFNPTTPGVATGTLTLTSDDPANPSAAVALTGTGVKAMVVLSSTSLDFGRQSVGSSSAPKTVTVLNTGSSPLRIILVAIGAGEPFSVSPSAPFALASQESQALAVTFSPAAEGAASGTLTLTTDDPDRPIITVSLTGTGQEISGEPGGCSCGTTEVGSSGMLGLLLLAALGSRRRRGKPGTYAF